jgi:hypothetical protein
MSTKTPDQVHIPEIVDENPLDVFQKTNLEHLLSKVEEEVRSYTGLDPADKTDYAYMGTVGARISSFKTAVEKMGKDLVDPIKAQTKEIDALRKMNKDRCDALRQEFLAPRVAYDAEVAAHAKAVADAFELFNHGHLKVAEFGNTELADFEVMIERFEAVEMTESFFGARLKEATESKATGLKLVEARRDKWVEDEKLREAGRKALQVQQDKEAADRHAARQAEAPTKAPESAPTAPAPSIDASDAYDKAKVHRAIVEDLVKAEVCSEAAARELVKAVYNGKIRNLSISYE